METTRTDLLVFPGMNCIMHYSKTTGLPEWFSYIVFDMRNHLSERMSIELSNKFGYQIEVFEIRDFEGQGTGKIKIL